jgi:hypothetical protein
MTVAWAKCRRCGIVAPVSCHDGMCVDGVLCDYCLFDIAAEQDELLEGHDGAQPDRRRARETKRT